MSLTIRRAGHKDSGLILGFIKELARFERAEHEVLATEEVIIKGDGGN